MSNLDKEIAKLNRQRTKAKKMVTQLCKIYLKEMKPLELQLIPSQEVA